ncbi:LysR family transcriptional regulator, partial [Agrobacterium sp. DKPNP3]|uniref:LysR family transcriptional regulator n=1 Tax=Agrobacterium sp. DKPNP3 TaxID=3457323 RepID=UPI00404403AA
MYTLKQLEAFCATAAFSSFTEASKRLVLTQSTIAKRVGELESSVGAPLFHRAGRTLHLTPVGEQLLVHAQEMMALHERITGTLSDVSQFHSRLRIGATDIIGLTWLPALIQSIRTHFPKVRIEPEIDGGVRLYERLDRNEIDIALMPGPFSSPTIESCQIGEVENVWMAAPSFKLKSGTLSAQDVSELPVIGQPDNSALTLLYRKWFAENGFNIQKVLSCNSLGMVAKLTTYGLGLSYLPKNYFTPAVGAGELMIVEVEPRLPPVQYFAFYKRENAPRLIEEVLVIISEVISF